MLRSAPMAVLSSPVSKPLCRVAQSQVFWARRLRFDLNPEPDYCHHCEGRHSFQRHRVSSHALVPLDARQHTAILARQVRRIHDHTVWVTCEWRIGVRDSEVPLPTRQTSPARAAPLPEPG